MPEMPAATEFADSQLEFLANCPLCQFKTPKFLFSEKGWQYWRCPTCTLIFLNPRLDRTNIGAIYDNVAYHSHANYSYSKRLGEKQLDLLGKLGVNLQKETRIFEDGAGIGAFISACHSKGIAADGCDLGLDAVTKAKRLFDVNLRLGTLETTGLAKGSLDVLVGFNLLSHLYDPSNYASLAFSLLRPGGYWFVRTGDRAGIMKYLGWGNWSAPEHVYHYTRKSLILLASSAGFHFVKSVPAFDSTFPGLLMNFSRSGTGFKHRLSHYVYVFSYLAWTSLRMPKEDVYVLFRRPT